MRLGNDIQGALMAGQKLSAEVNTYSVGKSIKEDISLNKDSVINKDKVETVASKLNEFMGPLRTKLKFELHDKLDNYYVSVVNTITDETIREIPPKQFLDMYADMLEFMGILIDERI